MGLNPPFSLFLGEEKEKTGRSRSKREKDAPRGIFWTGEILLCLLFHTRRPHGFGVPLLPLSLLRGPLGDGSSNVLQSGSSLHLSSKRTKRQKYNLQRAPQSDSGGRRRVKSVWSSRVEWYNPAISTAPHSALFSLDRERPVSLFSGERKEKWGVQTSQLWEWQNQTCRAARREMA